jgi:hypothetical protein
MKERLAYAYYVIVDVDKIQELIFESSRLKHIVGASILIAYLTSEKFCLENNILDKNKKVLDIENLTGDKWLEIYFGGGNLKLLFADKDKAILFLHTYQLHFYKQLESASFTSIIYKIDVHDESQFEKGTDNAERELNRWKQCKQKTANSYANPVFEVCSFCKKRCLETGTNSTIYKIYNIDERKHKNACRDCWQKDRAQEEENLNNRYNETLLAQFVKRFPVKGGSGVLEFMTEFDNLKAKEGSFLGIVTVDGNRFGEKVKVVIKDRIKKETEKNKVNLYINQLNQFSKQIKEKTLNALWETMTNHNFLDRLRTGESNNVLLFRPIIIGGDDICFVMDGRQALPFTEILLKELEKQFSAYHFTFAAGISITKPHFPFFVAHGLSESLGKNVKRLNRDHSGLDFEVIFSSSVENLEQMRKSKYEYTLKGQTYVTTLKPYFIEGEHKEGEKKENLIYRFLSPTLGMACGAENRNLLARNKIKRLRTLVRKGETESCHNFRLMIGRMSGEERKGILNRLAAIYRDRKKIWVTIGDTKYNNFIDISELNEFYKGESKGDTHVH